MEEAFAHTASAAPRAAINIVRAPTMVLARRALSTSGIAIAARGDAAAEVPSTLGSAEDMQEVTGATHQLAHSSKLRFHLSG